jgi:hypothetical protein
VAEELVATRKWKTKARIRVLVDHSSRSLEPAGTRKFRAGEECIMFQWGRAGPPIKRDWWDSFDIDGAHIIPAEKVQVAEVLEEVDPEPVRAEYESWVECPVGHIGRKSQFGTGSDRDFSMLFRPECEILFDPGRGRRYYATDSEIREIISQSGGGGSGVSSG